MSAFGLSKFFTKSYHQLNKINMFIVNYYLQSNVIVQDVTERTRLSETGVMAQRAK